MLTSLDLNAMFVVYLVGRCEWKWDVMQCIRFQKSVKSYVTLLKYVVLITTFLLVGCGKSNDDGAVPTIVSFTADNNQIFLGESSTLKGVFEDGVGVIDNNIGQITSNQSVIVVPIETTVYSLKVSNSSGVSRSLSVTVNVTQPPVYNHLKQLVLPKNINIISGQSLTVYFDDILLVDNINNYIFVVLIDGEELILLSNDRLEYFADPEDLGDHTLEIIVNDLNGLNVDYGISNVRVSKLPLSKNVTNNLLVIGDSLTANGGYVRDFGNKILSSGISDISFIGTVSKFGYNYEGYGGNAWKTYFASVSLKSPFVYADTGLDFSRYFDEKLNGNRPDYIIIMLGINDIFHIDGNENENINDSTSEIFQTADLFISELQSVLPDAKLMIASNIVPNVRPEAFFDDYGDDHPRENYRAVQHMFVRMQQEHFSNREVQNIYFLPVYYGVDSLNGFPDDNALHPNALGYSQIANMFFNEFMYLYSLN